MNYNSVYSRIVYTDVDTLMQYSMKDTWSAWGPTRIVSMDDIQKFAALTNNHQWIHEDSDRCKKESVYGGLIAHGVLLVALIPSLLPDEGFEIVGYSVRIIRGIDHLRLPYPVYSNDTIQSRVRMVRAYHASSGKGTIIDRMIEVWSLGGTRPSVTGVLKLQYF